MRFSFYENQINIKVKTEENIAQVDLKKNYQNFQLVPSEDLQQLDCEMDYYQSNEKVGCKIRSQSDVADFNLSHEQKTYLVQWDLDFSIPSLIEYGPYKYERWKVSLKNGLKDLKFVLDQIKVGNDSYIELSTKVCCPGLS